MRLSMTLQWNQCHTTKTIMECHTTKTIMELTNLHFVPMINAAACNIEWWMDVRSC